MDDVETVPLCVNKLAEAEVEGVVLALPESVGEAGPVALGVSVAVPQGEPL